MVAWILLSAVFIQNVVMGQNVPIGSGLSDGVALVYESGGVAQDPWVYDSVRIVVRDGFDRCVHIVRRSQPERETCVREDTLLERTDAGEYRRTRPIGPGMQLDVVTASGQVMRYETGAVASRRIAAAGEVSFVSTTITTRDKDGAVVRRLREEYAPALLTALRGTFEEPDGDGGWKTVRKFSLREIRVRPADRGRPSVTP